MFSLHPCSRCCSLPSAEKDVVLRQRHFSSRNSWFPGQGLNWAPSECKSRALPLHHPTLHSLVKTSLPIHPSIPLSPIIHLVEWYVTNARSTRGDGLTTWRNLSFSLQPACNEVWTRERETYVVSHAGFSSDSGDSEKLYQTKSSFL
jgi:hypothetical protein